jgi:hypothetical protein
MSIGVMPVTSEGCIDFGAETGVIKNYIPFAIIIVDEFFF